MTVWGGRKPNPRFPACAQVARRLLAEVAGCVPGDQIPDEGTLIEAARAAADGGGPDKGKAIAALQMLDEIGGL